MTAVKTDMVMSDFQREFLVNNCDGTSFSQRCFYVACPTENVDDDFARRHQRRMQLLSPLCSSEDSLN